jgi:hypothetical protein
MHRLLLACESAPSIDECIATMTEVFPEAEPIDLLDCAFTSGALIIF